MMLILFDYGHGGKDPGAVYKGRKEAQDVSENRTSRCETFACCRDCRG